MQQQEVTKPATSTPATTTNLPHPQVKKPAKILMREAFGLMSISQQAWVSGLEPGLANVPDKDQDYIFEEHTLRQLQMFWLSGTLGLLIEGDPAAGKTSLVEQWHARTNVPLYTVACAPETERWQLIGQLVPRTDGAGLTWIDGPVLKACRQGVSLMLDEGNTLDPGVALGFNALFEGKAITIPETGETVKPSSGTRFFITQNAVCSKAMVAGRNIQDVSFEDRFSVMRVSYVKPETEKALVTRVLTRAKADEQAAGQIAQIVVDTATKVREAYRADNPVIAKPLSTRAVIRWACYTYMYGRALSGRGSAPHTGLAQCVPMSAEMLRAVGEMLTAVSGINPDGTT